MFTQPGIGVHSYEEHGSPISTKRGLQIRAMSSDRLNRCRVPLQCGIQCQSPIKISNRNEGHMSFDVEFEAGGRTYRVEAGL